MHQNESGNQGPTQGGIRKSVPDGPFSDFGPGVRCIAKSGMPVWHRFPQTQSSRTDPPRSRKWMSGPAGSAQTTARDTLAQPLTGRKRQIVALLVSFKPALRKTHPSSAGRNVFFLDKSLSWMSRFSHRNTQKNNAVRVAQLFPLFPSAN